MDIFNAEDRRTVLDLLRRVDFNDAEQLFNTLIAAAHGQGKVDGSKVMADGILAKLGEPPAGTGLAAEPLAELERDMRQTVISKFRHRGEDA